MPYVLQATVPHDLQPEMLRLSRYLDFADFQVLRVLALDNWSCRPSWHRAHTLADIGMDDSQAELIGKIGLARIVTARDQCGGRWTLRSISNSSQRLTGTL